MFFAAAIGFAGAPAATAAPLSGAAAHQLGNPDATIESVHCRRWLPHRHMGAKPHGLGFGCGKAKAMRTKRR
jgi:hypothetical protein